MSAALRTSTMARIVSLVSADCGFSGIETIGVSFCEDFSGERFFFVEVLGLCGKGASAVSGEGEPPTGAADAPEVGDFGVALDGCVMRDDDAHESLLWMTRRPSW